LRPANYSDIDRGLKPCQNVVIRGFELSLYYAGLNRSTASSAAAGFAARANSDDCGDFAGCATIALRTGVGPFDGMSLSAILLAALTLSCPRKGAARKYTESGVNLFSSGYSITSLNVTLRRIRNGHPDSLGANRKLRGPVPDGEI
jgi:hypothetical protein